ncbi:protein Aster-B-like isoform X1 [Hylaeus anthracinus]|uniref:protein Aster-B-like isoform X1 n=1 Tax=Hylaeus volcanicus TaxID=313075 RepID=UPI0023B84E90|nr:protein Aster-B-like isoform X1 [Hylaeus volcanicus]XP_054001471.1 protein Aster-B-like isoform X1 [Hylaeus anthracinus]
MFEVESLQKYPTSSMNKSVEDLLISSREVMSNINSAGLENQNSATNMGNGVSDNIEDVLTGVCGERCSPVSSPNLSPRPSPKARNKRDHSKVNSDSALKESNNVNKLDEHQMNDAANKSSDSSQAVKISHEGKKETRGSERKKKPSWYNVLYPTYKSRSEDFKRIFKDVPDDERLVVDYSCALQREILVHGRLYVSQNYVCFYANIFSWETLVSLRWKDVTSITKEKTALVIPNAISICTATDKFFLTSFGARDKTYVMLFRVWQNALIGEPMNAAEMWQLVHSCYGDELGLTSEDEDYVPPISPPDEEKLSTRLSVESFSEVEGSNVENLGSGTEQAIEAKPEIHRPRPVSIPDATDLSDTTESEAEKHGFISVKPSIRNSIICTSPHEGRQISKAVLPIHIDHLFTLLFTNSKFFLDFQTARKTTDLVQSAWMYNEQTSQKIRNLSFTIALSQAIGPRTSHITETQIMLPCSRPGHLYSIDIESVNAGIPYADSFSVLIHYCITSISENETSITIYAQIKYKKNVWGFVKGVIEKNCWAGIEEYFTSLIKALTIECEENISSGGLKRKTRRRRRVTTGITLQTHSSDHSSPNLQNSLNLPRINDNTVSGVRGDSNMIVSSMLLIAVLCLMVINGLLYYKLWGLEEAAAYTIMDLHVLKNTPKTDEDWIHLLQQQESLHNVEMRKWQRVLHTAAQLLRQTEESLTELQMSIHPTATEKMFSVLKPSIKSFNSRTEQRSHSEI